MAEAIAGTIAGIGNLDLMVGKTLRLPGKTLTFGSWDIMQIGVLVRTQLLLRSRVIKLQECGKVQYRSDREVIHAIYSLVICEYRVFDRSNSKKFSTLRSRQLETGGRYLQVFNV